MNLCSMTVGLFSTEVALKDCFSAIRSASVLIKLAFRNIFCNIVAGILMNDLTKSLCLPTDRSIPLYIIAKLPLDGNYRIRRLKERNMLAFYF